MSSKLTPLADRVIVTVKAREEMTRSGIILPDTSTERPQEAEVIAVGPGRTLDNGKRSPIDVRVGDNVVFAKYSGTEVKQDERDLLILRESDILAVVVGG